MLLLLLLLLSSARHSQDKRSQRSAKTNDVKPALNFSLFLIGIYTNSTVFCALSLYFKWRNKICYCYVFYVTGMSFKDIQRLCTQRQK